MSVINTNVKALAAQGSLSNVNKSLGTAMERLSTGLRINSAADDAAGLAITNRMTSQIRGYAVAIRNSNDGISMTQTAEGAMGQVNSMLQRMRELSVQAANGALSDADRGNIQQEVSQLKMQIDDVANKTNHNNINLLDGSAGKIVLQTGVNAGDTMTIGFGSVKTKDIGLGPRATLSSNAVTTTALASGDVLINGVEVGASLATDDYLSTASQSGSAIAKAAAINRVSNLTGVKATVGTTTNYGTTMATAATTNGTITINGVTTAAFNTSATDTEVTRNAVVVAINNISSQTGVRAINTKDDNQGVVLVADDGRNIVTSLTTHIAAGVGITAGTVVGDYTLSTEDGSPINVSTKVGGLLVNSGLAAGTFQADTAQTVTKIRSAAAAAAAPSNSTTGVLNGNTLIINDVQIDAAVASDDKASDATAASSTKAASAIAIAAAINKKSAVTGVTAKAEANVVGGSAFTAAAVTDIFLNGVTISANFTTATTRAEVMEKLNTYTGQTGVVASANGAGIKLTAADGRNISIATVAGAATALGLDTGTVGLTAATNAGAITNYSKVSMSSDKTFEVKSGSEGNTNFALLGFRRGTFGGTDGQKIATVDVSTVASATMAIKAIDGALDTVSGFQAKAGAYQNRLDAVVSNLTESTQNMSASRSRILDTDYATETTAMARSQIVAQAATAMLAQANQSAQSVLSLLK
jgi:flagellin